MRLLVGAQLAEADAEAFMGGAENLGEESSAVALWPHQTRVVQRIVSTFPERYLLCDEVGLGKTLEGGAIIKQLTLTGQVRRCLILAPKSVCRQWQEEPYESFLLNVPEYDGAIFRDYFQRELSASTENPWDAFPIVLASSQLVKRRERAGLVAWATIQVSIILIEVFLRSRLVPTIVQPIGVEAP